jgi:hypothetical protein
MVEVLGSGVNITAVSSLGGVHVASVLAQTELSRLHFRFKLSSVGSGIPVLNAVSFMGGLSVSLEVRFVVTKSEVRLSQCLSHLFGLVRDIVDLVG